MQLIAGRFSLLTYTTLLGLLFLYLAIGNIYWSPLFLIFSACSLLGFRDLLQKKHAVLGNYPLLGRFRYFFETIRPELRQYFWESDSDKVPYSRNQRAIVYQRAKSVMAARPFGSMQDMYVEDFNWLNHSMQPTHIENQNFRIQVGTGPKRYDMSLLNISGTSFGAMSPPGIQALSAGAKIGGFAHNTGEGSLSPHHEAGGGDTIWQIATGYFGCRTADGKFDREKFKAKAALDQVKMIEIKLSQGAKPGHGGILLAPKVTPEIARTRGVEAYKDCISPSRHSEFSTPNGLLAFAQELRDLSGGKPVGIKLCVGHPWEFIAIVKAMVETGSHLDFVTVDGAEGGTGAAPAEFTDHLGSPLRDALVFVDNTLRGAGIRDRVKVGASGKIISAYDIIHHVTLGADWCNMARPFMFALGCIQARNCASGHCPTGLATMDPQRYRVVDVADRAQRVANFHKNTLIAVAEMLESAGLQHPDELTRHHIERRLSGSRVEHEADIYPEVETNALNQGGKIEDKRLIKYWSRVSGTSFQLQAH